jgi:hypothetical protein
MIKYLTTLICICFLLSSKAQLTVEKIMRDPKWIGTSPSNLQWSAEGTLYFQWNPEKALSDSAYFITIQNHIPQKATGKQKLDFIDNDDLDYNESRTMATYSKNGDVFLKDLKSGKTKRITQTTEPETNPHFSFTDTRIVYTRNQNLYSWDIVSGELQQLTNLRSVDAGGGRNASVTTEEAWLKNDQLQYFEVLKERKLKREAADAYNKNAALLQKAVTLLIFREEQKWALPRAIQIFFFTTENAIRYMH